MHGLVGVIPAIRSVCIDQRRCLDDTRRGANCRVVGGWSAMLRVFLEHLFLGDLGLATVGLPLNLSQQAPVMLFAALTNILADGDGFRHAYDWRGASSLKPCLVHHNVVKKVRRLALAMWGWEDSPLV